MPPHSEFPWPGLEHHKTKTSHCLLYSSENPEARERFNDLPEELFHAKSNLVIDMWSKACVEESVFILLLVFFVFFLHLPRRRE